MLKVESASTNPVESSGVASEQGGEKGQRLLLTLTEKGWVEKGKNEIALA